MELDVVDPAGRAAEPRGASPNERLVKERPCAGSDPRCGSQRAETVYWPSATPPRGVYRVTVRLARAELGLRPPLSVRFGGRLGDRTFGFRIDLAAEQDAAKFQAPFDAPRLTPTPGLFAP